MIFKTILANTPRIGNALRYWFSECPRSNALYKSFPLNILTSEETIDYIIKHRCSISRFGDGEIDLALGKGSIAYQDSNNNLRNDLVKILQSDQKELLVCIPCCLSKSNVSNLVPRSERYWRRYIIGSMKKLLGILPPRVSRLVKRKKYGVIHYLPVLISSGGKVMITLDTISNCYDHYGKIVIY